MDKQLSPSYCRTYFFIAFCVAFLCLGNALQMFRQGRSRGGMLGRPKGATVIARELLPPDQWFTQPLDHFDPADLRHWKQRYFVNDTFYKAGGPVFLMIGGEGRADPIWMLMGQWIEYAKQYNALCLQLEHRYYGSSHPTSDLSTENLEYLSSEQALADLANFVIGMSASLGLDNNKWIAFGGSYPGSLAAWFRLKYPHLVHASIASSAPIFAKLNFYEYLEVVSDSLDKAVPGCTDSVSSATLDIQKLLVDDKGVRQIKEQFKLCDDIDSGNTDDIANLFNNLAGNFENVVQYNKDNREFEGAIGTNVTIDVICGLMTDTSKGSPLARYALVNALTLETYSQKCLDFKYNKMISQLQDVSWNSSVAEGGRQWMYQTCTEFGYYQSSDYDKQPFGRTFPIRFSVKQCKDIFGAKFTEDFINTAIRRTNTMYGGYDLSVTRVVFPNGSTDPWHALGITIDLGPTSPAIFIMDAAHCANMYPDSPSDTPQLKSARLKIRNLIGQWLKE